MQKFPVGNVDAHVAFLKAGAEEHEVSRLELRLGDRGPDADLSFRCARNADVELARKDGLHES
jgi:hypothetical protein